MMNDGQVLDLMVAEDPLTPALPQGRGSNSVLRRDNQGETVIGMKNDWRRIFAFE
jgi:hypothetical protein